MFVGTLTQSKATLLWSFAFDRQHNSTGCQLDTKNRGGSRVGVQGVRTPLDELICTALLVLEFVYILIINGAPPPKRWCTPS